MKSQTRMGRLLAALPILASGLVQADYELNMTTGVTATSQSVYDLHMIIFWICVQSASSCSAR